MEFVAKDKARYPVPYWLGGGDYFDAVRQAGPTTSPGLQAKTPTEMLYLLEYSSCENTILNFIFALKYHSILRRGGGLTTLVYHCISTRLNSGTRAILVYRDAVLC